MQPTGLKHATTVLEFYLAGSVATVPNPLNPSQQIPNIWYTGSDSCASQLASLLQSACMHAPDEEWLYGIAHVVVKIIEEALAGTSSSLGACAPDIPAIILALVSTSCPSSESLYNPLTGASIPCQYNAVSI